MGGWLAGRKVLAIRPPGAYSTCGRPPEIEIIPSMMLPLQSNKGTAKKGK
jgi:hypothetical protein